MGSELQKLNEYAKMGANLPKSEFVKVFRDVIRKGTSDEIKSAYSIINNLASTPDLENFCQQGLDVYRQIQKSHIGYEQIKSKLQNFQNSPAEIAMISMSYSKIQDSYFLEQTNKLVSQYPALSGYIEIRKTKKEMEEEKESLKEEFNSYQQNYSYVFERLNQYLSGQSYTTEQSNKLAEELQYLKVLTPKYKNVLGDEKYKQIIEEIEAAKYNLDEIVNGIDEEQRMWAR